MAQAAREWIDEVRAAPNGRGGRGRERRGAAPSAGAPPRACRADARPRARIFGSLHAGHACRCVPRHKIQDASWAKAGPRKAQNAGALEIPCTTRLCAAARAPAARGRAAMPLQCKAGRGRRGAAGPARGAGSQTPDARGMHCRGPSAACAPGSRPPCKRRLPRPAGAQRPGRSRAPRGARRAPRRRGPSGPGLPRGRARPCASRDRSRSPRRTRRAPRRAGPWRLGPCRGRGESRRGRDPRGSPRQAWQGPCGAGRSWQGRPHATCAHEVVGMEHGGLDCLARAATCHLCA